MENAIAVEHVSKKFGKFYAVRDANFVVPRGCIVGLVGGNGAGKTTTLSMIMGLTLPTSGSMKVLGHDMAHSRQGVLGLMNFQSPYVSMPSKLTVFENLNVFGRLYNVKDLKNRIDELIYDLGLGELLNCQTGALSAGQKTRVAIAKALLNAPQVLVLDEPTASLDPVRASWVRKLLQNYQGQQQATILMSSHNIEEVEKMCDTVIVMHGGRVLSIESPANLMLKFGCSSLSHAIDAVVATSST